MRCQIIAAKGTVVAKQHHQSTAMFQCVDQESRSIRAQSSSMRSDFTHSFLSLNSSEASLLRRDVVLVSNCGKSLEQQIWRGKTDYFFFSFFFTIPPLPALIEPHRKMNCRLILNASSNMEVPHHSLRLTGASAASWSTGSEGVCVIEGEDVASDRVFMREVRSATFLADRALALHHRLPLHTHDVVNLLVSMFPLSASTQLMRLNAFMRKWRVTPSV